MTPDEIHAFRRRVVEACTMEIARATVPFFVRHKGRMVSCGSGTLLQVADRFFIVTAAHVLDHCTIHNLPFYLPPGTQGGTFIHLNHVRAYTTPIPEGRDPTDPSMREDDPEDVGICELSPEIVNGLGSLRRFVRAPEIDKRKGHPQALYMVIGYPRVFARSLDDDSQQIYTEPIRCVTQRYEGTFPEDRNEDRHLFLEYPKEGLDHQDGMRPFPHPNGISGGGIWRLADPDKVVEHWQPDDVRFVGIEHSWNERRRYVRGTTAAMALAAIWGNNEDLRPVLDLEVVR
jgi:hypothetical protein